MHEEEIRKHIKKIKKYINRHFSKGKYETVLNEVGFCAEVLYQSNLYYMDPELEEMLRRVSEKLVEDKSIVINDNIAVFYDGFGLENRGLAKIYLNAISKFKKIVYITYFDRKHNVGGLEELVVNSGGEVRYISSQSKSESILELNSLIHEFKPKHFFFYSMPNDVVGTVILNAYKGVFLRYQINLTDHAFWLCANCIDYCLEFREYGASVSYKYRKIPKTKMIMIPYYPTIAETEFQGYPFENGEEKRFVFSGGALYKTFSDNNYYYQIIDSMMNKYSDVFFWYAGEGDTTRLDALIAKYPGRIYYTHERPDFFEIIKRCYFYLSTYPVCGGLMFQYVAKAGKIPLTLRFDEITDGFLIDQSILGIQYDTFADVMKELEHIMEDIEYVKKKETIMLNSIISEEKFVEAIGNILDKAVTNYSLIVRDINTDQFRMQYVKNFSIKKFASIIASPNSISLFTGFPIEFMIGATMKISKRIRLKKR